MVFVDLMFWFSWLKISWNCRVVGQVLAENFLRILYILSCCPLHFLNHFFNLMTERGVVFTNKVGLEHIKAAYLQKLEDRLGTWEDFWKPCISLMGLPLPPRWENFCIWCCLFCNYALTNRIICFREVCWIYNWEIIPQRANKVNGDFWHCPGCGSHRWCRQKSSWHFAEQRLPCPSIGINFANKANQVW